MAKPDYLNKRIVVFDTETTGLTSTDEICEFGFSIFENGELVTEYGEFVKPTIPIPASATAIHNISNQDVADSKPFEHYAATIVSILQYADYIAAYNYEFDRRILGRQLEAAGYKFPSKPVIDVLVLYRKFYKMSKGKKLINAADKFGFEYLGAHRAIHDATMTGKVLIRMAEINPKFPKTIKSLCENQYEWLRDQFEDLANWKKRQGQVVSPPEYDYFNPAKMSNLA